MKFLVDAQLPRRMTGWLAAGGCDAVHTWDLPKGNRTTDEQILIVVEQGHRVLVTKDADFVDSHLLHQRPAKLLLISTGNISNSALEALITPLVADLVREFATQSFLELSPAGLSVRG